MNRPILFGVTLALCLLFMGCSEKAQNPVGFGLVQQDDHWQVGQAVIDRVLADSCITISTGAGEGFYLLVGSWEQQESRIVLRFEDLPDSLSTLLGTKLILTSRSEANEDSLKISVHALQSPWQEATVSWENPWGQPGGDFQSQPIAEGSYAMIMGDRLELDFNEAGMELVRGWLQGQTNDGIILRAADPSGNNVKSFYAAETIYDPRLEFTFAGTDTADTTVRADSTYDAYIVQPDEFPSQDFLCVSDGVVRRSWIHFDLTSVPQNVFINRATLALSLSDFESPLGDMSIATHLVTDLETLAYSTLAYSIDNLFEGKESLEIDITELVQEWIDGTPNAGLVVKPLWEYSSLSRAVFYSSKADSLQRPILTIVYTFPPAGKSARQSSEAPK